MEMSENEIIDFCQTGDLGGFVNPAGIAGAGLPESMRMDSPVGGDDQSCAAAFDVVPIDIEGVWTAALAVKTIKFSAISAKMLRRPFFMG